MQVAQALQQARGLGLARLDALLLLGHLLGRQREWLLAHDDVELDTVQLAQWAALAARRAAGEPLAYIVGEREFHGLALQVNPAVLVPRPETEMLVAWAVECRRDLPAQGAAAVDLGTGSGAIALALQQACPDLAVSATDASADALAVARANAQRLGLAIEFFAGDWWQPLEGRRWGLAVSNPPYIAAGDPHLAALAHEPSSALVSGADGLDALRAVVAGAPEHLLPGGWLLLEHGHDQAAAVQALLSERGFAGIETRQDLAGLPRCTGGRLPR